MGVSMNPTEFQTVEGFYEPEGAGLFFALPPLLIAGVVLLLGLAGLIGWLTGSRQRPSDDPTGQIYDAIRKALAVAAGAPRDEVVSTARRLKTAIDDSLGAVLLVSSGLNGGYAALDRALNGMDDGHPRKPAVADKDRTGIGKLVINARRVVVNTLHPHADEAPQREGHDDHGEGDQGHGHGHEAHGSKPVDARTQVERVRKAIDAVSDHWSDKVARLEELRVARRQLTQGATSSHAGRFPSRSPATKR